MRLIMDLGPKEAAGVLAGLVQANLLQIEEAGKAGSFPVTLGLKEGTLTYVRADPQEEWMTWTQVPGLWHVVVEVKGVPGVDFIDPSREGGMGDIA